MPSICLSTASYIPDRSLLAYSVTLKIRFKCLLRIIAWFVVMSGIATNTWNTAPNTIKCTITSAGHEESLKDVITASTDGRIPTRTLQHISVVKSELLAQGGYNNIWLVEVNAKVESADDLHLKFFFCEPNNDSFLPYQLENEVAWLAWVSEHTSIPVPKVYTYSAVKGQAYIAMEYIEGKPMDQAWKDLKDEEKEGLAKQIAAFVIRLGETRFEKIGGLNPDHELSATVEGPKFFKGRVGSSDIS